jgi:hypothetical protein
VGTRVTWPWAACASNFLACPCSLGLCQLRCWALCRNLRRAVGFLGAGVGWGWWCQPCSSVLGAGPAGSRLCGLGPVSWGPVSCQLGALSQPPACSWLLEDGLGWASLGFGPCLFCALCGRWTLCWCCSGVVCLVPQSAGLWLGFSLFAVRFRGGPRASVRWLVWWARAGCRWWCRSPLSFVCAVLVRVGGRAPGDPADPRCPPAQACALWPSAV